MRVSDGLIGETYIVEDIHLAAATERRLEILGMTQGAKLSVLNKKCGGAVILKVRGTRFAVGKQIADGIRIGARQHE